MQESEGEVASVAIEQYLDICGEGGFGFMR